MQDREITHFLNSVSVERFRAYGNDGEADRDVCAKYLWNIRLCESFYPMLNLLEVALRNSIHRSMTSRFGNQWFDNGRLELNSYQKNRVDRALEDLEKLNRGRDPGRVVAELQFGFWCSMLGRQMDRHWRGDLLKRAFPGMQNSDRKCTNICRELHMVRDFRNRVFHHERILHMDLHDHHDRGIRVLGWICPSSLSMLSKIDHFQTVHDTGLREINRLLIPQPSDQPEAPAPVVPKRNGVASPTD